MAWFSKTRKRSAPASSVSGASPGAAGTGEPGAAVAAQKAGLGLQHHRAGRLAEAEALYREALALAPQHIDALHFLGVIAYQREDPERAAQLISQALSLNAANAPAHNNLGNALKAQGRLAEAAASYRRALALSPDYVDAQVNLGVVLRLQGQLDEAIACYRRAIALAPEAPAAHTSLGNVFHDQGKLDEAVACHRRAIELAPDFVDAHDNLGGALVALGQLEEADAHYRRVLSLKPALARTRFAYALLKLMRGDYESGFPLLESRFDRDALPQAKYAGLYSRLAELQGTLRWQDGDLAGKTLLVWADQGLGDSVMLMRYLPRLKDRGAGKLIVHCEPPLIRIMHTLSGVDRIVSRSEPPPFGEFDCHCPMMSLPLLFKTRVETIPNQVPYLTVPEALNQEWARKLRDVRRPRVGLCWAGRKDLPGDDLRSIRLTRFAPLLDVAGASFVSLQKGEEAIQAGEFSRKILDRMDECNDLMDTAALMEQLDLIVSVDTGVVHLAGALGRPVWLLNCFASEWRWMLHREDSPWYPTMRIFRQRMPGDWDEVMGRVVAALKARIAS